MAAGDGGARTIPMFPLGTVLVPTAPLPLHVFEPRYRTLVRDCLAGEREFGVVLIERGSEVGGGDTRVDIGTLAGILEVDELPDGRSLVVAVGLRRIRVVEWLPDNPYPRAAVEELEERECLAGSGLRTDVVEALVRVLALVERLGGAELPSLDFSGDPVIAGYQALARSPLGPFDRQRVLQIDDPDVRLRTLAVLLDDAHELLRMRVDEA